MTKEKFKELNSDLDFAKHNLLGLVAIFGYESSPMLKYNKKRAICMADCVIEIMTEVKAAIMSDGSKDIFA